MAQNKKSAHEIVDILYRYMIEYNKLVTEQKNEFTDPQKERAMKTLVEWINETTSRNHAFMYMEGLILYLDSIYVDKPKEERLALLHYVLTEIDHRFVNDKGINRLIPGELRGSHKNVYFKSPHFWKKNKPRHGKFQDRPWNTFGIYNTDHPANIYDLDDINSRQSTEGGGKDVFSQLDVLNIGLFPLPSTYHTDFQMISDPDPQNNTAKFLALPRAPGSFEAALDDVVNVIRDKNIHVACFPELSLCDPALNYLAEKCARLEQSFFMLVGGSFHRLDDDVMRNRLPVQIYMNQQKIKDYHSRGEPYYSKREPYRVEVTERSAPNLRQSVQGFNCPPGSQIQEGIVPGRELLVFNSRKFGDIGFVICRDFIPKFSKLVENYTNLVDHLFVVSMDMGSSSDFLPTANKIGLESGIAVYYTNALSFDTQLKSPSFISIPSGGHRIIQAGEPYLLFQLNERE